MRILLCVLLLLVTPMARAQDCPQADIGDIDLPILIGTKFAPPFVMGGLREYRGLSVDLWTRIAHCLRLVKDVDYVFVDYGPNEELIEAAQSGNVDIAIAAVPIRAADEERIDFSHPYFEAALGTLVAKRPKTANITLLLSRIFRSNILYIVLGLVGCMFAVAIYYWWVERKNGNDFFEQGPLNGFYRSLIWAALLMFQGRGDAFSLRSRFGQLIFLMLTFFGVTIISSFTAIIASSLTLQALEPQVRSIDDLRNRNVGVRMESTAEAWADSIGLTTLPITSYRHAQRNLDEGVIDAFIDDREVLRYFLKNRELKNASLSPLTIQPKSYAIVFPENSPLREPVNRSLLWIIEGKDWKDRVNQYFGSKK